MTAAAASASWLVGHLHVPSTSAGRVGAGAVGATVLVGGSVIVRRSNRLRAVDDREVQNESFRGGTMKLLKIARGGSSWDVRLERLRLHRLHEARAKRTHATPRETYDEVVLAEMK